VEKAGRRPGTTRTKEIILAVAQQQFVEHGFEHTSIRSIARDAGVNPSLVMHFFANKSGLYAEAIIPVHRPLADIHTALAGDRNTVGWRLATYILTMLEDSATGPLAIGLMRASMTEPAATMLKDVLEKYIIEAITTVAINDRPRLRAELVCAQYTGIVMTRYIQKIEPLASTAPDEVIALIAPALQRYVAGELQIG